MQNMMYGLYQVRSKKPNLKDDDHNGVMFVNESID